MLYYTLRTVTTHCHLALAIDWKWRQLELGNYGPGQGCRREPHFCHGSSKSQELKRHHPQSRMRPHDLLPHGPVTRSRGN
jgi:hypothetical protein